MNNERSVEQLMKLAGEREMPPDAAVERARQAAHESWQHMLRAEVRPASRRWFRISLGIAAAAGIAWLVLAAFRPTDPVKPALVAHVTALDGRAVLHGRAADATLSVTSNVFTGETLETTDGRVALTLGNSLSLRIDRGTRLRFDAPEQVTLLAGSLYVDSGGINAATSLRVDTPAGAVRHVGTQFQVFVAAPDARVRVREGRVSFTPLRSGAPRDVAAGDELRISAGRADLSRGLPSFGADWEWCASVAPPFDIDGRPLAEFLAWAAREHGWQLRYASESLQQQTYEIRLHGALDQSSANVMVERVALITGVPLQARDGVLWVGTPR